MSSALVGAVVLTREPHENAALARELLVRGAEVLETPCVRTELPVDSGPLAAAIRGLGPGDRLVVTSPRGADAVLAAVRGDEHRAPITAIGDATALQLFRGGIAAEVAHASSGAALARELPLPIGRVLLARSDRAMPDLPDGLRARGAVVDEVVAYRTVAGATGPIERLRTWLRMRAVIVIVFASPSAVDGFLTAVPVDELRRARVVAIGRTTAARVRARAGLDALIAERPTDEALLVAIEGCLKEFVSVSRSRG